MVDACVPNYSAVFAHAALPVLGGLEPIHFADAESIAAFLQD